MRRLILIGAIALALPAFAAEDSAPAMEATTPESMKATTPEEKVAPEPAPVATSAKDEAAPAVEPEVAETEPALPAVSPDAVSRGTFATAVEAREPVDSITSLGSDRDRVYYFSELVGVSGRRLTHRWEYEGEVVAEVPIDVGGPRWRAYSSKNLDPSRLGEWTVSIIDENGHVVHTDSFVYEAAAPAPDLAAPSTKPAAPAATPSESAATPAAPAAPAAPSAAPAAPSPGDAPEKARSDGAAGQP
jgi:hypothetical protein